MTAAPAKPARRRRWPWVLALLALVLATGAWWVNRQLEPERLTAMVLARAGTALGLELSIEGTPEYALRPEPRLVLPGLTVRQPGASAPLLSATRAEFSLPWSSLAGSASLVITRVDFSGLVLDIDATRAWLATLPPGGDNMPTLSRGIGIKGGTAIYERWRMTDVVLEIDRLEARQPLKLSLAGHVERDGTGINVDAQIDIEKLSQSTDVEFSVNGEVALDGQESSFSVKAPCHYHLLPPQESFNCLDVMFLGTSPMPTFKADNLSFSRDRRADGVEVVLIGWMRDWPAGWPPLPAPVAGKPTHFDFHYDGPMDASSTVRAKLRTGETAVDSSFVIGDILKWAQAASVASLPPIQGTASTPVLELGGATLEGVQVSIEDDDPAKPEAETGVEVRQ